MAVTAAAAVCAYCLRRVRVRRDGNVQRHNRWLDNGPTRCSGSGRPPKPEPALKYPAGGKAGGR
jgi:hypothetical protein